MPDLVGVLKTVQDNEIETHGRVVDGITPDQREYYGFDADDFPEPSYDGRVVLLMEYP